MTNPRGLTIDLDGPQWLVVHQDISGISPQELLRWFIDPSLLKQWWAPAVTVDPVIGGTWEMAWPSLARVLTGQIVEMTPTSLIVSWVWANEPTLPARVLVIRSELSADGATLRLLQGPYRQSEAFPEEDADRTSHIEGWEFFLPKLQAAIISRIS